MRQLILAAIAVNFGCYTHYPLRRTYGGCGSALDYMNYYNKPIILIILLFMALVIVRYWLKGRKR